MKFLNWLAPNLWRRLGVTSFVIPGKRTHGSEEILKNFQLFDCFWNILVQCNTWMVQTCWESIGKCWLENRDGLAVTMPTHTQHTHSVECSHSFCFTFFFFLNWVFYVLKKWSEVNMCLTFYLRAGGHIREKVHSLVLCVPGSQQHTPLNCLHPVRSRFTQWSITQPSLSVWLMWNYRNRHNGCDQTAHEWQHL